MTETRKTFIPDIPENKDDAVDAIREIVEIGLGRRGDTRDQFVTFRDLESAGIASLQFGSGGISALGTGPGTGGAPSPGVDGDPVDFGQNDPTKPPRPLGVVARGISFDAIMVVWLPPNYSNHAFAEIFAAFDDNVATVLASFDSGRPIGGDNLSQYFMGSAQSTQFLHQNIGSTVPSIITDFPLSGFGYNEIGNTVTVALSPPADPNTFELGDLLTLIDTSGGWLFNGERFRVKNFTLDSEGDQRQLTLEHDTVQNLFISYPLADVEASDNGPIEGFKVRREFEDEDDLDAALNPRSLYYWVRFVSTAGVVGQFQSDAGIPGVVMLEPELIMNILTARIRESHLANVLLQPIDFVRGPILELNPDGSRKYPTIRAFVNSIGGDLISEYDEDVARIYLGYREGDFGGEITEGGLTLTGHDIGPFGPDRVIWLHLGRGPIPDSLQNFPLRSSTDLLFIIDVPAGNVFEEFVSGPGFMLYQIGDGSSPNALNTVLLQRVDNAVPPSQIGFEGTPLGSLLVSSGGSDPVGPIGITTAAAFVDTIRGKADASGAYIETLKTLTAAYEAPIDSGLGGLTGLRRIISQVAQRALVEATDSGAIALVDTQVGIIIEQGGTTRSGLNQTLSQVTLDQDDRLINSFTVKLQQRGVDGLLTTAGFGLSLESGVDDEAFSSFIISADEFAVMGPGRGGAAIMGLEATAATGTLQMLATHDLSELTASRFAENEDAGTSRDAHGTVLLAIPPDGDHPLNGHFTDWRGKEWFVVSSHPVPGSNPTTANTLYRITLTPVEANSVSRWFTNTVYNDLTTNGEITNEEWRIPGVPNFDKLIAAILLPGETIIPVLSLVSERVGSAIVRTPSIPFIIDTSRNIIGIRGTLIVDGLISANEIEVNRLLRANTIWAGHIVTHGLAANRIITDKLATYDSGGWALVINSPNPSFIGSSFENRVLQLSRYAPGSGGLDANSSPAELQTAYDDPLSFIPQFTGQSIQTSFFLDAQDGNVYLKGALAIGSGARIKTDDSNGSHGVLIDAQFPLMVYPISSDLSGRINAAGLFGKINWSEGGIKEGKTQSLFYCSSDGTAGFNTSNDAIYIDSEPLHMPSGGFGGCPGIRKSNSGGNVRMFASGSSRAVFGSDKPRGDEWFFATSCVLCIIGEDESGGLPYGFRGVNFVRALGDGTVDPWSSFEPAYRNYIVDYVFTHVVTSWSVSGHRDVRPGQRYYPVLFVLDRAGPQGNVAKGWVHLVGIEGGSGFIMQVSKTAIQPFGSVNKLLGSGEEQSALLVSVEQDVLVAITDATYANGDSLNYANGDAVAFVGDP